MPTILAMAVNSEPPLQERGKMRCAGPTMTGGVTSAARRLGRDVGVSRRLPSGPHMPVAAAHNMVRMGGCSVGQLC